jgi:rubrerythrin
MVATYRCSNCGYFHVGPAPETCPVCGAPQSAFKEYAAPDLTGTKTLDNLKAAFAGESQANRRYTLWKRIAELEGAPQSAIDAFDRAAAEETAHALGHLAFISGGATTTAANLKAAAEGESYECTDMYPEFAATAEAEGLHDLAFYFRRVGEFENEHRAEYVKALEELEG